MQTEAKTNTTGALIAASLLALMLAAILYA